jgi:hypothetical protein
MIKECNIGVVLVFKIVYASCYVSRDKKKIESEAENTGQDI